MTESLTTTLRYYGISPWEIEVLYGFLNSHFTINQEEIEAEEMETLEIQLLSEVNIANPYDGGMIRNEGNQR